MNLTSLRGHLSSHTWPLNTGLTNIIVSENCYKQQQTKLHEITDSRSVQFFVSTLVYCDFTKRDAYPSGAPGLTSTIVGVRVV
jgi:hypothetical protein